MGQPMPPSSDSPLDPELSRSPILSTTRSANPAGHRYEVVVIEPPLMGQLETTVAQDGSWRVVDAYLIERQTAYAASIARLLGYGSAPGRTLREPDDLDAAVRDVQAGATMFFVPHMTLCDPPTVDALGLTPTNFYGGAVPHRHQLTKLIMHGLRRPGSSRPSRWNEALADSLVPHVLPGFSTFDAGDLRDAALDVLERFGGARIKLGEGSGGLGQFVLRNEGDLTVALDALAESEGLAHGAGVEVDLVQATTFGVVTENIGDLPLSTVSAMRRAPGTSEGPETRSEAVTTVGTLDQLDLDLVDAPREDVEAVVRVVRALDREMARHLPDRLVTRNHYQGMVGRDAHGGRHVGVIEQGWRRGQVSANALLAAGALVEDLALDHVTSIQDGAYAGELTPEHWVLATDAGVPYVAWITGRYPKP